MAKNIKFFFDRDGTPKARGPGSERILMTFLEVDVQGSEYICHDLIDDVTAIEDNSAELREFSGNAHAVTITTQGVLIEPMIESIANPTEPGTQRSEHDNAATEHSTPNEQYTTGLKHFKEIMEDWEAFILDDQILGDESPT